MWRWWSGRITAAPRRAIRRSSTVYEISRVSPNAYHLPAPRASEKTMLVRSRPTGTAGRYGLLGVMATLTPSKPKIRLTAPGGVYGVTGQRPFFERDRTGDPGLYALEGRAPILTR